MDISSNTALNIFATEDGARSSGRVVTPDSIITIQARNEDEGTPPKIDILTHGQLNMKGSDVNIEAIQEEGEAVGGHINVKATGNINIESAGTFTVDSDSFNIDAEGNVTINGKLEVDNSSSIAGFYIAYEESGEPPKVTRRYMYTSNDPEKPSNTVKTKNEGIYFGTDGINFGGGKFIVTSDGTEANFETSAGYIFLGRRDGTHLEMNAVNGEVNLESQDVKVTAGHSLDLYVEQATQSETQGEVHIGVKGHAFTIGSTTYDKRTVVDGQEVITKTPVTRMYSDEKSTLDDPDRGVYIGTDGISLGSNSFKVTEDGDMTISGKGTLGSCTIANWSIDENKLWAKTQKGSSYGWVTLSSDPDSIYRIWAGAEKAVDVNEQTGEIISEAPFYVTEYGKIHSISGDIGGWEITKDALKSGKFEDKDHNEHVGVTGMAPTKQDTDVAFWAGANDTDYEGTAPFKVYHDGSLVSTKGYIAGWKIEENYLYGRTAGMSTERKQRDEESDTDYANAMKNAIAFWAGSTFDNRSTAPFRVKNNGDIYATSGTFQGKLEADNTSTVTLNSARIASGYIYGNTIEGSTIRGTEIYIGERTDQSYNFSVDKSGTMTSKDGFVGNWTIGTDSLSSGSGNSHVELNSGSSAVWDNRAFSFWAGGDSVANANFKVGRDGYIYINALMVWLKDHYEEIDFSKDFNKAILESSGSWNSKGSFTATFTAWKKVPMSVQITASVSVSNITNASPAFYTSGDALASVELDYYINSKKQTDTKTGVRFSASNLYKEAWNLAARVIKYKDDSYTTLLVPKKDGFYNTTDEFSLSKCYEAGKQEGAAEGLANAKIKISAPTESTATASVSADGTVSSFGVTVYANAKIEYDENKHTYKATATATTNSPTSLKATDTDTSGTEAYKAGWNDALSKITFTPTLTLNNPYGTLVTAVGGGAVYVDGVYYTGGTTSDSITV